MPIAEPPNAKPPNAKPPTPDPAVVALTAALGAPPPASVAALDPDVLAALTSAIAAERRRQEQALGDAVDHALRLVPRPLRGLVRRMITR